MAKCIMVQGTMSGAGKSLLVTALCRIFTQDGYRVAPFKSQNMALNSYVTADGLELGRAQAAQAEAAGIPCDVRMNPILLKPSSDTGSQLIVMGEVRGQYDVKEYFRMKRALIPEIMKAYNSLAEEHDIIVIEGAGSPAEINLRQDDIVNMGLAELVNAPVILAGDIDRGGVFAQLYGTVALLQPEERKRVIGTVINKFRGDVELLRPGLRQLEELTSLPVLGVIPWMKIDIEALDNERRVNTSFNDNGDIASEPCETVFTGKKTRTRRQAVCDAGPFAGARLEGYEIHMGRTRSAAAPFCIMEDGTEDGAVAENVFGTYLHGLFDSGELVERVAGWLAERKGIRIPEQKTENRAAYRNRQYDLLADTVRSSLDMKTIEQAMEAFAHDQITGTD